MIVRLFVALLAIAAVWTFAVPGTVDVDATNDPEAYADAMGLPEPFETPRTDRRLGVDPTPHRAAIERIESILYRRGPAGFGDGDAVSSHAARLADAVMRDAGSGNAGRLRAHQAGSVLFAFASRAGVESDAGYALPDLVALRGRWEAVRTRVFLPADWMRTASADLDHAQDPPPPAPDPRAPGALADATGELERLMARGRREVERLGEPRYDPEDPRHDAPGQVHAWTRWAEDWRVALHEATSPLDALDPPPGPDDVLLREAERMVREAAESLRHVPDGAGMWPTPFRPAWEARFRDAGASLARARSLLDQASGSTPAAPGYGR